MGKSKAPSAAAAELPAELAALDDEGLCAAMASLPEPAQLRAVAALLALGRGSAVAHVAASSTVSATARKEARRAISVLRSRGVAVPDVRPAPAGRVVHAPAADPPPPSYLSSFDPSGSQMLWAVGPSPGGGFDVVQVAIGPDGCTHDADRYDIARRRFRELIGDFRRRAGLSVVEVPRVFALWRLAQVKKVAERLHHGVAPPALASASELFRELPEARPAHPALAALGGEPSGASGLVRESGKLLSHPRFARWYPDPDQFDRLGALVQVSSGSVLAADPRERKVQLVRGVVALIDEQYDAERRGRIAERLRDQALLLAKIDQDEGSLEAARMAWCTARAIEEASPVAATRPSDVPFLVALMVRPLGPQTRGDSAADPDRLVLTVEEALAAQGVEPSGASDDRRIIL